MIYLFAALVGYVLGSISFSYYIGKKVAKIDIRKHGSGNAGATNTLRVLGKGPAALVLLLDMAKGIVAVLLPLLFFRNDPSIVVSSGVMAIIGHNWPVFTGFKGGKGIATTIGVMFMLSWLSALLAGLIAISVILWKKYVSLGSLILITLIPVFMYIFHSPLAYIVGALITAAMAYFRHYENLQRLWKGNERKIGLSHKRTEEGDI